jgi:AraC-like DNA-binding protein
VCSSDLEISMVSRCDAVAANDRKSGAFSRENVPDLEVVDVPRESSFKVWAHGYPYRTVRWHFHPEYEIHLVTETSGRAFIGDYISTFRPGNLVMVGPNLPHNWISGVARGETVARRGLVLQFTQSFMDGCIAAMPEMRAVEPMLAASCCGIEFPDWTGDTARPILEAMLESSGPARMAHFFRLLALLQGAGFRQLASASYRPSPETYVSAPLNHVIDHVARNISSDLRLTDMAVLSGFTPSSFSRAFKRHTGLTFVRYVNRLRIDNSCDLLMTTDDSVADICFQVGFNNLSNFNRHFIAQKRISPSAFRREYRENVRGRFVEAGPDLALQATVAGGLRG